MAQTPNTSPELAVQLIQRFDAMKNARATWDSLWQDIGNYVMPRKAEILSQRTEPSTQRQNVLFDSTAVRANMILANGQLSWMTPHESPWFNFEPPEQLSSIDEVKQWFQRCTKIAQTALAQSNFYSEIHELYLDRGAFGTSAIYCEPGQRAPLVFRTLSVGSFALAEDDEALIDTCYREFELTLRQARQMFGAENLSEKMQKELQNAEKDAKGYDKCFKFIHAIYPRDPGSIDPRKADPKNMPIASCYVEADSKHVAREAGYKEQPFMATRYLKWGNAVYGWSPSWVALPEARQLNFLEKQMDALAELAAFPRMLVPSSHEGDIDFRAAGVTYYDPSNPNAIPKEWATGGRYDVGEARGQVKRDAINNAFHVDLFQMFAGIDQRMTAREVSERSSEKLTQFSPTFARMTVELFNPLLARVFAVLLRGGFFPPPPQQALIADANGAFLPEPKVSYNSRIALAIRALDNSAFQRTLESIQPIATIRPDLLDNYDLDRIARDMARNDGLPADWLLPEDQVQQARQARAQAQTQQAQVEQAQQLADAAGKAGNIKPESALGQALAGAAQ